MLEIRNITKKFDKATVLEDFTYQVKAGHIYGLVGYNGAGKTTLMKILCGIYRPERGSVLADGVPVYENEPLKRSFFMVQDIPYFLPQSTLYGMALYYSGFYPAWDNRVFHQLTDLFGLDPDSKINGFSKGMQRQASLILAIATCPKYLLLDESFDGLDLAKRNLLKELMFAYMEQRAVNVIVSSHNLRELEGLCDHVCMIQDKRLRFGASVEEMSRMRMKYRVLTGGRIPESALRPLDAHILSQTEREVFFLCSQDLQAVSETLRAVSPDSIEALPITLEEIFLDQTEAKSYDFKNFF